MVVVAVRVCGGSVGSVGAAAVRCAVGRAKRSEQTGTPKKEKPKKRKKECKTEGVNRATRKFFWKKYSFRAKRGKEDFFQKPEGLDLAGARREAIFAIPFWLIRFEGLFAQSESINSDNHH